MQNPAGFTPCISLLLTLTQTETFLCLLHTLCHM